MNILTSKFLEKLEKISKKKKKLKALNFAESNVHRKSNVRGSFETKNLFFFSLKQNGYLEILLVFQNSLSPAKCLFKYTDRVNWTE